MHLPNNEKKKKRFGLSETPSELLSSRGPSLLLVIWLMPMMMVMMMKCGGGGVVGVLPEWVLLSEELQLLLLLAAPTAPAHPPSSPSSPSSPSRRSASRSVGPQTVGKKTPVRPPDQPTDRP